MAVVIINPLGMAQYFNSTTGPLGRWMGRQADDVREQALQNAQGPIINVDTFDLVSSTNIQLDGKPTGVEASIGSSAVHRGANYPGFVTRQGGEPGGWLIQALRDKFPATTRVRGSNRSS